jgi:hypothetical protein
MWATCNTSPSFEVAVPCTERTSRGRPEGTDGEDEPEEALLQIGAEADLDSKALKLKAETATKQAVLCAAETPKSFILECDCLMSNFEVRRDMRAGEADALRTAKAVLAGAHCWSIHISSSNVRDSSYWKAFGTVIELAHPGHE